MQTKIVSVDFQKDFTTAEGCCYKPRPSVNFVKNILVPYLKEKNIKIAEIISDYRAPRPGDRGVACVPGTVGYESEIPDEVKEKDVWIKCMNSPIWTRENIGDATKEPGLPYQDTKKFSEWIERVVGSPKDTEVVLVGLTLDCCVLCTAQEFSFRGYKVKILKEATDPYSGDETEKDFLCKTPTKNWATVINWEELKKIYEREF